MSHHIYCLFLDKKVLVKSSVKDILISDSEWLDDLQNQLTWTTVTAYRGLETKIHYCMLDKETSPELPLQWLRPLEGNNSYAWHSVFDTKAFTKNDLNALSYICENEIPSPNSNELWLTLAELLYRDKGMVWSPAHLNQLKISRTRKIQFNALPFSKIAVVLGLSALLGLLYRVCIYGNATGLNILLFSLVMLWGLTVVSEKKPTTRLSQIILSLSLVQSLQLIIFSNESTHILSLLSLPGLIALYGLTLQMNLPKGLDSQLFFKTIHRLWIAPFQSFVFTLPILQKFKNGKDSFKLTGVKKDVLMGIAFSIPILLIAFALLSSSDFVFNHMLSSFFKDMTNPFEEFFGIGTYLMLFVTLYCFGFLFSYLVSSSHPKDPIQLKQHWSPVMAMTLLILVNALYLFYASIQIPHLYFKLGSLPQNYTYAEYARSGFFELVFLALLNMTLSCLFIRFVQSDNSKSEKWFKSLNTLMSILTMNFLISSFYKLCLYEQAYGYTHLRLWVQCFTIALGLCLIWLIQSIWKPTFNGFNACALTLMIAFTMTTYGVNDAVIAKWNISHYKVTHQLDVDYLSSLSSEAADTLLNFETNDPKLKNLQNKYSENLRQSLKHKSVWEWNYMSHRSIKILETYNISH